MRVTKKKVFVLALIVLCLSCLAYGTAAFFTDDVRTRNVITTGDVEIDLLEWADADETVPFPETGVSGVMPGLSVTKIVEIKNEGTTPAFVRMKAEKDIKLAEGSQIKPDLSLITLDIDTEHWTEKDGWYYYYKALEPNEMTAPLFTTVTFEKAMGNEYQNATATVIVSGQAVQVKNNPGTDALSAQGWPAPEV